MKVVKILLIWILVLTSITSCSWFNAINPFSDDEQEPEPVIDVCVRMDAFECYVKGQELLQKQESLTDALSLVYFLEACERGSADACEQAGKMYQSATGTGEDLLLAIVHFSQACEINQVSGCYQAAVAYKAGKAVEQDLQKAEEYFTYSCENAPVSDENKGQACTQKGLILLNKSVEEQETKLVYQAFDYFSKACTSNDGEGCFQVGQSYREARGVAGSENFATQYYVRGCNNQYAESCFWAGNMNVTISPAEATQFYFTGCSYNNVESCFELAERYRLGRAITKNLRLARITYQQVCSDKVPVACYWQAWILQQELNKSKEKPKQESVETLLQAYKKACDAKLALACFQLAMLTKKAEWVEADPPAVAQYLSAHCNDDEWLGCYELAYLFKAGDGVVQDFAQATNLLTKVCEIENTNPITLLLTSESNLIARKKQWQMHSCRSLADMLWEYPEKKDKQAAAKEGGEILAKDNKKALVYFNRACQFGWLPACLTYAIAQDKGIATDKNVATAFKYYKKTCALNTVSWSSKSRLETIAIGCYNLAVNYRDGISVEQNIVKANDLFKKSCELNQAWACYNYAISLTEKEQATFYFQQSCNLGLKQGCILFVDEDG